MAPDGSWIKFGVTISAPPACPTTLTALPPFWLAPPSEAVAGSPILLQVAASRAKGDGCAS